MIRWTGLAPWEFEFPFPGSLTSRRPTSFTPRRRERTLSDIWGAPPPHPRWRCSMQPTSLTRCKATWKRGFELPWREAGPPNLLDEKVDSDQQVVNKELSISPPAGGRGHSRTLGARPLLLIIIGTHRGAKDGGAWTPHTPHPTPHTPHPNPTPTP